MVLGISDHNLIYAIKKHASEKSKPITTQSRSYEKFDEFLFKQDIDFIPWQYILSLDDPQILGKFGKNCFLKLLTSMLQ